MNEGIVRHTVTVALAAAAWAGPVVATDIAVARTTRPPVTTVAPSSPAPDRAHELLRLLRHDCGACHGMRLTGGLGPPLTPEALREKPAASLVATIVSGRAGTAMPPWRRFLSETEAAWLVARLVAGDVDGPR